MTPSSFRVTPSTQLITGEKEIPFLDRVLEYAERALRPSALQTDKHGVTHERIEQFSELKLLNHLAPPEFGGAAVDRTTDRRLHEAIAGACLNTWLVWAQHGPMVGRLAEAHAAGRELPELGYEILRGRVLVGAAVSDVRKFPDHFIEAVHNRGSWTFSGTVSWVSGWGLNTVLTVAAVERATRTVVTALVPVTSEIRPVGLGLSAVHGSRTERVKLADVVVPDEYVIDRVPLATYRTKDFGVASDARPHHFGLAETVLAELDVSTPAARQVAQAWRPRIAQLRADAYGLSDAAKQSGDDRHRAGDRLRIKAEVGEALSTLTRALLISRAGRGIQSDDTAQLHARSALFLLVQGQTSDVREVQLNRIALEGTEERT
ncbi:acyl-CoA/acyl-ACP dehydrogenase [Rhodococcoides fascians A25f]|uniref:acyl-CoA dehydrogenase family protein n=1 Tax=Rhodococcoides fascians TaxID=1828 RepID=UPI00055D48D2|nr:acyl-CoA dehydrogenase family protein [Rhodococcus fascians]QII04897.1 acyl-CoA/acyl-ACP dehydrogenase [Rhodococcus fascians A25f]